MDIYSLGIIFFEMCHPPVSTLMERAKILTDIRKSEIKFPDSFDRDQMHKQVREYSGTLPSVVLGIVVFFVT